MDQKTDQQETMPLSSNSAGCKALFNLVWKEKPQAALTLTVHKKTVTAVPEQPQKY
jgi:hypothetical protein